MLLKAYNNESWNEIQFQDNSGLRHYLMVMWVL